MNRTGTRAGIPVICVGNFTLGGTGKTPTAIAIARLLDGKRREAVLPVARLWRQTRRTVARRSGAAQRRRCRRRAAAAGAARADHRFARPRPRAPRSRKSSGATVIVMDDGLQNPSLAKDLSIAVVDGRRGFGNGLVFPAGPLRAPLQTQFGHVQALLLIGKGPGAAQAVETGARATAACCCARRLEPAPDAIKAIGRRKVFAFAGIGDPEKFFMTLASAGIEAQVEESFADHHPYSEAEALRILARCESEKLIPVTTEKDLVRLGRTGGAARKARHGAQRPFRSRWSAKTRRPATAAARRADDGPRTTLTTVQR